jgi:hypothetical protein
VKTATTAQTYAQTTKQTGSLLGLVTWVAVAVVKKGKGKGKLSGIEEDIEIEIETKVAHATAAAAAPAAANPNSDKKTRSVRGGIVKFSTLSVIDWCEFTAEKDWRRPVSPPISPPIMK